jgi:hypothetical protein
VSSAVKFGQEFLTERTLIDDLITVREESTMLIWWLRSRKCAKGGPAWFRLPAIPCWVDEANVWLMGGFKHLAAGSLMSWFGASIVSYGSSRTCFV